jgi:hypothetical protein
MSILHLCNTFFEWELAGLAGDSLASALTLNPITAQLQFLPYLYGKQDDAVLASAVPENPTLPTYTLDQHPPFSHLETWGASKLVQEWALERDIHYLMPPWDVVKMVNTKTYSFSKSPLPGATLLYEGDPLKPGYLLKSCFGTAGRGHILTESPKALAFCKTEWASGLPVIAEPFVERTLDFSTQWIISPSGEIAYLGATECRTGATGTHISNTAGGPLPAFVEEQKAFCMPVLEEMAVMGYFGPVGIDAMVYNSNTLQPIVEINARKTMGWLTLQLRQEKPLTLAYTSSKEPGPLPRSLGALNFSRQIELA